MSEKIEYLDSTLRDGSQALGVSFGSPEDMLKYAKASAKLGTPIIEGGFPESNQKVRRFFQLAKHHPEVFRKLAAFGGTRRKGIKVDSDLGIKKILECGTPIVTIVGKASSDQVRTVLKADPDENLKMVYETVAFLKKNGKMVIFDAEHFFSSSDKEYALKVLHEADRAGADRLVLCDTIGAVDNINDFINAISSVKKEFSAAKLGVHMHDDQGMAVALTLLAVELGIRHIQGTFNGYGERCGNANLTTIIPTLQLKKGYDVIPPENMKALTVFSRELEEQLLKEHNPKQPWTGKNAFWHKGGYHIDAMIKDPSSYELVDPARVGNYRQFAWSEQAGSKTFLELANNNVEEAKKISLLVNDLESQGYEFEFAPDTLKLILLKQRGKVPEIIDNCLIYHVNVDHNNGKMVHYAEVSYSIAKKKYSNAEEGDGPVNALDLALRKGLEKAYPELKELKLVDYWVRVKKAKDPLHEGSAAMVWVKTKFIFRNRFIETGALHEDIIEASRKAFFDGYTAAILKARSQYI